jgi:hypothetical protein
VYGVFSDKISDQVVVGGQVEHALSGGSGRAYVDVEEDDEAEK